MKRTGFVYDERYLLHNTGNYHPESSKRLEVIVKRLENSGLLKQLTRIKAAKADQRWVETVHHVSYIMRFHEACTTGLNKFEHPDNSVCRDSFDAHETDLMSGTNLSTEGYNFISEVIMNLVNRCSGGWVVSVLEGGYNLNILPILVENHIRFLADLK
ncbi:MAG: hypothetical protein KJ630_22860 [Proteobacteria bacterium]|nr:hypothetical protein [Pseudomonadota bacterium]